MRKFYAFLLKKMGWHYTLNAEIPNKCVICVAPHTSNWDFVIGMLFYRSLGGRPHFLMKKSWFFFPLNYIFRALGGFPVDRSKNTSFTDQMATEFEKREHFQLAITPEGTRKKNADWKTGFIWIALSAQVPITLASLDYAQKEITIMKNYFPTGDTASDLKQIKSYYKDAKGKYPHFFAI